MVIVASGNSITMSLYHDKQEKEQVGWLEYLQQNKRNEQGLKKKSTKQIDKLNWNKVIETCQHANVEQESWHGTIVLFGAKYVNKEHNIVWSL